MPSEPFTTTQRLWVLAFIVLVPVALAFAFKDKQPEHKIITSGLFPVIEEARVTRSSEPGEQKVTLPYNVPGKRDEVLEYRIVLTYAAGQSPVFWLTPDDCVETIKINDANIELQGDALSHRCDWQDGFRLDLGAYLKEGINELVIKITNKTGPTGLALVSIMK